jgi:hypothetical protein
MTTLLTHHTLFYDRNQEAVARMHFGLDAGFTPSQAGPKPD